MKAVNANRLANGLRPIVIGPKSLGISRVWVYCILSEHNFAMYLN